jgi:hypothetical protein
MEDPPGPPWAPTPHYRLFRFASRAYFDASSGSDQAHWGPATRDGEAIYFTRQVGSGHFGTDIVRADGVQFAPSARAGN